MNGATVLLIITRTELTLVEPVHDEGLYLWPIGVGRHCNENDFDIRNPLQHGPQEH